MIVDLCGYIFDTNNIHVISPITRNGGYSYFSISFLQGKQLIICNTTGESNCSDVINAGNELKQKRHNLIHYFAERKSNL